MALGLYFSPRSFTPARYDDAISRLKAAGAGAPAGRLYHVALEANGLIQVFDIWDSQESFEAFGTTLLPIMAELGPIPASRKSCPSTTSSRAEVRSSTKTKHRTPGRRPASPDRRCRPASQRSRDCVLSTTN
jgi:hypothetical protein